MSILKPRVETGYNARPVRDLEAIGTDEIEDLTYDLDANDEDEEGVCGFAEPFRFSWFFTITGAEYAHVYFWILKDLSWTQELKYISLFFGTLATLWCVVIFYHAFRTGNKDEVYNTTALFMWIFANYWWMTGETHDADYPDEPEIYDQRASESARILESALALLTIYYFAIIPFNLMPSSPEALAAYDGFPMFKSRFSWLKTFRQYENLHMYFWLAKDLAWNRNNLIMWFILLGPAVFLAGDFFFISAFCKNSIVDTVHYATIFLWVLGNATWALGEFFLPDFDDPIRIWQGSLQAYKTARWYSSWLLVVSLIPVVFLYCVWIPLTCSGRLDGVDVEPTIEAIGIDSAASTTVPIIYSLLPPLNDSKAEDGFVSIPRSSNNRNAREKRSGGHFDPNRFHYPSPFLAQPGRGGNVKSKEGLIDKEKDSASGGGGNNNSNEGGRVTIGNNSNNNNSNNNNNNNSNEHQKNKKTKPKKEARKAKVTKSKTHGMALQKGGTERSHLRNDGPELDSDESTTSSEDNDEQQRQRNDDLDHDLDLLDSHDHDIPVDDTTGLISGSNNAVSSGSGSGGNRGIPGAHGNGTNREAFI